MRNKAKYAALGLLAAVSAVLLNGARSESPTYKWKSPANLHTVRAGACSALLPDGSVLITGGKGADGPLATTERFNGYESVEAAPMSHARADHACVALNDGRVLVAGGVTSGEAATNAVEVFDPETRAWTLAGSMTAARSAATASLLQDGRVLVAGGSVSGAASDTLEIFDPATNTFAPVFDVLTAHRTQHSAAVLRDGRVLIAGGWNGEKALDTVDVFDPATVRVSLLGKMSAARAGLAATTLLDGRVYFSGGSDGKSDLASTDIFDPVAGKFNTGAPMSVARRGHLALRIPDNNSILLVGGTSNGERTTLTELYIPWWNTYRVLPAEVAPAGDGTVTALKVKGAVMMTSSTSTSVNTTAVPTVTTDKSDYQPGDQVTISGTNWKANEVVTFDITRAPTSRTISPALTVIADAGGNFVFSPPELVMTPEDLGQTYTVTGSGDQGSTAQTITFTDSRTITSVTLDGGTNVSVAPGASISAVVTVITANSNGNNNWHSTGWRIATASGSITSCVDHGDHDANGTFTETFNITAPSSAGTYNAYFIAYSDNVCVQQASVTFSLIDSVSVGKTTPTINWNDPADTTYGTSLSLAQLNASASVPGTFVYSPAAGTVLNAGVQTLSATFTPTDSTLYNTATKSVSLNVLKKSVTASFTATDKLYDGTNQATITTRSLSGVVGTDNVTLTGGTATFDNKNVGTNKTVTATGLSLGGSVAGNYILSSATATATAAITGATVTGAFTASNKVYDGNAAASITDRTISGIIGSDVVNLIDGTASFANKNVGTAKTVTGSGFTLSGADAGNYILGSIATTTADITAKSLTGSFTASSKVYDGNTNATIATRSIPSGVVSGDDVTLANGSATFDDKNVGTGKTVTGTGFNLAGGDVGNYVLTTVGTTIADITPKSLTGSFAASKKVYDGTTSATITDRSVTGKIGADDVSLTGGAATFDTKDVGSGKTVTGTGFSLAGAQAGNYALSSSTLTTTANVTPATVTGSFTVSNKVYDGNSNANIVTRSITGGVVGPETVSLEGGNANFDNKNVGSNKTVTGSGFTLGGSDAGNYILGPVATTTANITPATVAGSFTVSNKVYDGGTSANITARSITSGIINNDAVSLSGGTATFDTKAVGNGKTVTGSGFTLTGGDAGNYVLGAVATTTADITPKSVTGSFTATNKPYDGNTTAAIVDRNLTGKVGADDVSLTGGTATFDTKDAGTAKTVTGSGFTLSGGDAVNYQLASSTLTTSANINKATVTGSFTANNKVYDGNANATIATRPITNGVVGSETVTLEAGTASFDNKNVGADKTVMASGFTLGGADSINYILGAVVSAKADITPATVTGAFTASNKVYDGSDVAAIQTRSFLNGGIGTDQVELIGGSATFASKNAGSWTVTGAGFTVGGVDGGNYVLGSVATTTATITPKMVTGSFSAADKVYNGNTDATITGRDVNGKVNGDDVSLSGGAASFANKYVGTWIVTGNGFALAGSSAANYTLESATLTTSAKINPATVQVSFTAGSKVYDGNNAASILTRSITSGKVGNDNVALEGGSASFENKNAGTNKTVTGSGFTLAGADAGNYLLGAVASTTANITPASVTGSFTAADKVYDGTMNAAITNRSVTGGVFGGDQVWLTGGTAVFASKNVGSWSVTGSGFILGGADGGNYALSPSTLTTPASISAKSLIPVVTVSNKVYDGTTVATIVTRSFVAGGVVGADSVMLSGGLANFVDAVPGSGKLVNVAGLGLAGADSGDYALASATTSTTADITNLPPVVTITSPSTGTVYGTGAQVTFAGKFTDLVAKTHTALFSFDDGTTGTGTVNESTGSVSYTRTFATAGVYKFTLKVTDQFGLPGTADSINNDIQLQAMLVVFQPDGSGFVTGGGWINSSAASCTGALSICGPTAAGKANFGFVSKYQKGASKPTGETEFQFKSGNLDFHSTAYEQLVVSGPLAQYKGTGTINGQGSYRFMITGRDGRLAGGGGVDGFRMKITDSVGTVIYDNLSGADEAMANVQVLGGGSVQIQSK